MFIRKNLRLFRFLKGEKRVTDAADILLGEFAILFTEVLAQGLEPLGCVDELHLALSMLGFSIGEHPDIGGNAGIIEKIERERDDGLQPVVFDDIAADIALALPCIAGEKGGAVVYLGDPAAKRCLVVHLGGHVGEEEHLPVAGSGDKRSVKPIGVVNPKA